MGSSTSEDPTRPAAVASRPAALTHREACRAHSHPFSPFQFTCPQSHQHEASGFAHQNVSPPDKANMGTNPSALHASRYRRRAGARLLALSVPHRNGFRTRLKTASPFLSNAAQHSRARRQTQSFVLKCAISGAHTAVPVGPSRPRDGFPVTQLGQKAAPLSSDRQSRAAAHGGRTRYSQQGKSTRFPQEGRSEERVAPRKRRLGKARTAACGPMRSRLALRSLECPPRVPSQTHPSRALPRH